MNKTYKTLGGEYQTPDCEVVRLICDGAVIMASGGSLSGSIDDWLDDGQDTLPF